MALPKLESLKYNLEIPSTGEIIEYRPFLVSEEKILLMAHETGTQASTISALKDIVKACTFNKVDLYSLTMYDLEYIFLNLRAKSVGETANINIKCSECDEYVSVKINLSDVKVRKKDKNTDNKIELTDTIGVTLKPPGLKEMEKISRAKNSSPLFDAISSVIESIYDESQIYPLADASPKEVEAFIDSLNHQQLEKIQAWSEKMPRLEHKIEFTCKNGHVNKRTLTGLNDFFA